jgi:putative spermidine/putrescine transport system permease protein
VPVVLQESVEAIGGAPSKRGATIRPSLISIIPLLPFMMIFGFFFLYPIAALIYVSFLSNENTFTISNYVTAFSKPYNEGFWNSVKLGLLSAMVGAIPGAIAAYFLEIKGSVKVRRVIAALNGVLANTGGVPLAFMFTAAFGIQGFITVFLKFIGIDLYANQFSLATFSGVLLVYTYFQLPLMIIVFSPAITALRREWREAASNLGASTRKYWQYVALPILFPSFLASFLLLFASGFSAYATVNALTVGNFPLTPLQIGGLLDGNVSATQVHLGKALGVVMIVISALAVVPYLFIQRRVARWTS